MNSLKNYINEAFNIKAAGRTLLKLSGPYSMGFDEDNEDPPLISEPDKDIDPYIGDRNGMVKAFADSGMYLRDKSTGMIYPFFYDSNARIQIVLPTAECYKLSKRESDKLLNSDNYEYFFPSSRN